MSKIVKNVVFVNDETGNDYYIPSDKQHHWNEWVEGDEWSLGSVPDYAVLVEGKTYVVDIVKII